MIVLTGVFNAKIGKERELENTLRTMIPNAQNETGTVMYIHRPTGDMGQFLCYEMYRDDRALEFHNKTPYFQDLLIKIDGLISEDPEIKFYEDIASISR